MKKILALALSLFPLSLYAQGYDPGSMAPAATPSITPAKFAQVVTPEELVLNSRIMEIAKSYLGVENSSGDNQDPDRNVPNPKIEELAHYIFHGDVPSEEFMGGWCDWFVTAVLVKAGVRDITETMYGFLLLSHGHFVTSPMPGDVVLMQGHIAFFAAEDPSADYVWVLGGNQEYSKGQTTAQTPSSSGGSGDYYGGSSSPHKKTPFLVHGLQMSHGETTGSGTVTPGDQDITVHIPAQKVEVRGFSVNYAKIPRSDITTIYRMNP
jgi:hypothetical protein